MILLKSAAVVAVVGLGITLGCSSATPATPRVALTAQVGPGGVKDVNDAAKCQLGTEPWVTIGDNSHPVSDGDQQGGANVSVSCTVRPDGNGFSVSANAVLMGQGSMTISGHFVGMAGTPPADQMGITAVFQKGDTGTFRDTACTVSFASNMNMGFAAGRVWGALQHPGVVPANASPSW